MKKLPADPVAAVDALRAERAALLDELRTLAAAPLPLDEATARLGALVDDLAAAYDVTPLLREVTRLDARLAPAHVAMLLGGSQPDPDRVAAAALVRLLRASLVAAWTQQLRDLFDSDPSLAARAIPAADRPPRETALREKLRSLELLEEQVIAAAGRRGLSLDRRGDADPRVLFDTSVLAEAAP